MGGGTQRENAGGDGRRGQGPRDILTGGIDRVGVEASSTVEGIGASR